MNYLDLFDEPERVWREKDTDFDAIREKYKDWTLEELQAEMERFKQEVLRRRAMGKSED